MVKVKNTSTSIVTLPYNDPADVCAAALKAGVQALMATRFMAGNETMIALMNDRPQLFVCPGTWRCKIVELKPGEVGEVEPEALLPRAAEYWAGLLKNGTLVKCS